MSPIRIDYEKLLACLAREEHHLRRLEIHDSVDSTNTCILRRPPRETHGLAVISREQRAGRGRNGHRWHSPPGGLYLSLGWHLSRQSARPLLLTRAVAAMAVNTLRASGRADVAVKWPNDIYCSGSKLGGVLVEMKTADASSFLTVTGIGINIQPITLDDQGITDQPVTDLRTLGLTIPPHALICSLLSGLSSLLGSWQRQSTGTHDPTNAFGEHSPWPG